MTSATVIDFPIVPRSEAFHQGKVELPCDVEETNDNAEKTIIEFEIEKVFSDDLIKVCRQYNTTVADFVQSITILALAREASLDHFTYMTRMLHPSASKT